LFATAVAAFVASCGDHIVAPPADRDFLGRYDATNRTLSFRPPTDGNPLRLEAVSLAPDTARHVLTVRVRIRNTGATVVGPEGVALFDFQPEGRAALFHGICDPPDAGAPPLPPGACLVSHRDAYGTGGLLAPGEASAAIQWAFTWSGGSFSFHARPVASGLAAPGEISGVVFDDRNGNDRRDPDEPGIPGAYLWLQYPDSTSSTDADSTGRFTFRVVEPGTYGLHKTRACCQRGISVRGIDIQRRADGSLAGFGSASFGCQPGYPHLPRVAFVDVHAARSDLLPCVGAVACTIPTFTPFRVRFTGASDCGRIAGFQWRDTPGYGGEGPWQPLGQDTLFLSAARDTVARGSQGDTLWALQRDTVTVYYANDRSSQLPSGRLRFRGRVRDEFGSSSYYPADYVDIAINFDPDTEIPRVSPCECPVVPPGCARRDSTPVGWITGIDTADFPIEAWIPFCAGDTLPIRSRVRFYARGHDDRRDVAIHPGAGLREVGFSYRYVWSIHDRNGIEIASNPNTPFSSEYPPETLSLPDGGAWRGGSIGWAPCPFDHILYASAVDEQGKRDGTPGAVPFFMNGAPSIDSLRAPKVLVLAPTCSTVLPSFCADLARLTFGPDTLLVAGTHIPYPWNPLGLGYNRFDLPLIAWGHDHPRDRNAPGRAYYAAANEGRIRSWRFTFDCAGPGCQDLAMEGEGEWSLDRARMSDAPGEQVSDSLRITFVLDTLCTTTPCRRESIQAVLPEEVRGFFDFSIEGRDWRESEYCDEPVDLGPNAWLARRGVRGRETARFTRRVKLVQIQDVRPFVPPPPGAGPFAVPRRTLR
jgi:hypothetical protein